MRELPTGTVTFLFTDIEGSTRLLRELGDRYAAVRDEHCNIIRTAIADSGGAEVGTEGDSFFVSFRTASDALKAAVSAQRGLSAHEWPPNSAVRVRMGLHTGEGVLSGPDYVGMDVHRAARIAAAAHGGQVIMSATTRALVDHAALPGVRFRDLGEHRLKDIDGPERLFDIVIEGLPAEFPPPRTLDARPNNLPLELTSFVGREDQLADIKQLIARTRLLTLTGAGGSGKTRLALQVAAETLTDYRDGAFFVDLSPVTNAAFVAAEIAHALGVAEEPGVAILATLKKQLADKELLLVIDNFEQVVSAGAIVEELLAACARLRAVITSRVVLALRGEHEYQVPPLELPDLQRLPPVEELENYSVVRLFVDRAGAVQPRFRLTSENAAAVAEIAVRLDGLPLAIELAATRVKVLSPRQILTRLGESLELLSSRSQTLPERQRTLRGAIAWSYELLEAPEQRLFTQLSVFSGGWALEAAESVTHPNGTSIDTLEGLTSLVDKSLVRAGDAAHDVSRFSMLETIREFAHEELSAKGEVEAMRVRHGGYFLSRAIESEPRLTGPDQAVWLDYWDREQDNLRAALRWAIDAGRTDLAQEAAGAIWRFWQQRGHLAEGRQWIDAVLAMAGPPTAARAKALTGGGGIAWWQIDHPAAQAFYTEALTIERELGDPARLAEALYNHAFALGAAGDIEQATRNLEESLALFRASGNEHGIARALVMMVIRDSQVGDWDSAVAKLQESVGIWRRFGDRLQLAFDLIWLAFAYGRAQRWDDARSAALESLDLFRASGNPTGIALAFRDLAFISNWQGRPVDALRLAAASESIRVQIGGGPPQGFGGMLQGDPAGEAREQLSEADAQRSWDEGFRMDVDEAVALAREGGGEKL